MAHQYVSNALLNPGGITPLSQLSPSQLDPRNVIGLRYLEVGATFTNFDEDYNKPPASFTVPLSEIDSFFAYDPSYLFRVVTIGLDAYSIRHNLDAPTPFDESDREPIAVSCPQLQADTGARWTALLANDFSIGIASTTSVSLLGRLPPVLTFTIGVMNDLPSDQTVYNFNATRAPVAPPGYSPAFPHFKSQQIRAITIRFYVKVSYEQSTIPFSSAPRGMGAGLALNARGGSAVGHGIGSGGGGVSATLAAGGGTGYLFKGLPSAAVAPAASGGGMGGGGVGGGGGDNFIYQGWGGFAPVGGGGGGAAAIEQEAAQAAATAALLAGNGADGIVVDETGGGEEEETGPLTQESSSGTPSPPTLTPSEAGSSTSQVPKHPPSPQQVALDEKIVKVEKLKRDVSKKFPGFNSTTLTVNTTEKQLDDIGGSVDDYLKYSFVDADIISIDGVEQKSIPKNITTLPQLKRLVGLAKSYQAAEGEAGTGVSWSEFVKRENLAALSASEGAAAAAKAAAAKAKAAARSSSVGGRGRGGAGAAASGGRGGRGGRG